MLASKTSHKRRRSSARGDASRNTAIVPRAIVTAAGSNKGKGRDTQRPEETSWAWKRLEKVIVSHPMNHCLQILSPIKNTININDLIKLLPTSSMAYLAKVPISMFLDPIFVISHIKCGSLTAVSKGSIDTDDCFCLDGKGVLHLSLTRDTYQTLGIIGQVLKQSRTSSGKNRDRLSGKGDRWMVRIDLLAPSFVPGRPGFDRTLSHLREWDKRRRPHTRDDIQASWEVIFSWSNAESASGSVMHFPAQHVRPQDIKKIELKPEVTILEDCWVPLYRSTWSAISPIEDQAEPESWDEDISSLFEWASLASLSSDSIKTYSRPDHLSAYEVTSGGERRASSLIKVTYKGLLSSDLCTDILRKLQDWLSVLDSSCEEAIPAIVSCSGFIDAPIAWSMESIPAVTNGQGWKQMITQGEEDGHEVGDYSTDEDDLSLILSTGPKARKKRQKKRSQRGFISRHQVGEQVKRPGTSGYNGWQVILFSKAFDEQPEYISVENVGGCLRC